MADKIRWGILGTGAIAKKFAAGLTAVPDAQLVAVGSRTQAKADEFGAQFNVPHRHGSYQALAADSDLDVVYVSSPHTGHAEHSLLCLHAAKAVLCEKPFAVNFEQAREVVKFARKTRTLLVEAMWSRFLPALHKLRQLLAEGAIGEVRMMYADFGFRAGFNPQSRLFDPNLAGGGLLDVGVYCVSLASMVMGPAAELCGLAEIGQTGVDEQAAFVLKTKANQLAVCSTGVRTTTPQEATILGADGWIRLTAPWWRGTQVVLHKGGQEQVFELPYEGNGYNCEAAEVGRLLREGKTQSDIMPLDETLSIMKTLDKLRAKFGVKYPVETRSPKPE